MSVARCLCAACLWVHVAQLGLGVPQTAVTAPGPRRLHWDRGCHLLAKDLKQTKLSSLQLHHLQYGNNRVSLWVVTIKCV